MPSLPHVAVLVETSRVYGRRFLKGIIAYTRLYGPWSLYLNPGDFVQSLPKLKRWGGTGIIARIENTETATAIARSGLPTIAMEPAPEAIASIKDFAPRISQVHTDAEQIISPAIDHLFDRGFRSFAFCGYRGTIWSDGRENAFIRQIRRRKLTGHIYPNDFREKNTTGAASSRCSNVG